MTAKRTKRLNWTGRITIDRSCVEVTRVDVAIDKSDAVNITLDLSDYSFPLAAEVVIEASHRLTLKRIEFGTIGNMIQSKVIDLSEFPSQNIPTFRLLIVDKERTPGRLLGTAERIKIVATETGEESRNILKVDSRDLGEETWRVEFPSGEFPRLVINRKIPNFIYRLEHDKELQGLILPVAFRTVLSELISKIHDYDDGREQQEWVDKWIQFCKELYGAADPRQSNDFDGQLTSWVDECVTEFAETHSFATLISKEWES